MADVTTVSNAGLGTYDVHTDEVTDPEHGSVTAKVQYVKEMDGSVNGFNKAHVDASGARYVSDQRVLSVLEEMLLANVRVDGEEIRAQPLTRSSDTISAALATDVVMVESAPTAPQFAFANIVASQTDSLLAATMANKRIRVLVFRLHTGGTATNVTFNTRKPGGTGFACSELFATAANGGHHGAFCPVGHFQTNIGEDLSVTTGAGSTVGIGITYVLI